MKRDEITFNQTHWKNPSRRKSSKRQKTNNDLFRRSDHFKENPVPTHHDVKPNAIFTPPEIGGKDTGPIISPPSKIIKEEFDNTDGSNQADYSAEKRKRKSSFRNEISSMMEDTEISTDEGRAEGFHEDQQGTKMKQENPFLPQFLSMLIESSDEEWSHTESPEIEESYDESVDYSILTDIALSMSESSEESSRFKHYYESQNQLVRKVDEESSSSLEKENWGLKEEEIEMIEESGNMDSSIFKEITSLFEESSYMEEEVESCHHHEESSSSYSQQEEEEESLSFDEDLSSFIKDTSFEDEESSQESDCLFELEESSSLEFCNEEENRDPLECGPHSEGAVPSYLIKAPVLLAETTLDINLIESLNIDEGISEITKVDFSLPSIQTNVALPSSQVFLKGVLMADIDYVSEGTFHTVKIPVTWEKVIQMNWKTDPILPTSSKKEYTFISECDHGLNSHYEHHQTFAAPVEGHVQSIHFVSHNDSSENGKVHLKGSAQLSMDFLQMQYVFI